MCVHERESVCGGDILYSRDYAWERKREKEEEERRGEEWEGVGEMEGWHSAMRMVWSAQREDALCMHSPLSWMASHGGGGGITHIIYIEREREIVCMDVWMEGEAEMIIRVVNMCTVLSVWGVGDEWIEYKLSLHSQWCTCTEHVSLWVGWVFTNSV